MIGVLLKLHKKAQAIKGRVAVCGLQPQLHKVFQITKLDTILDFTDTEEEAISRVRGKGK
jgi:anti-anti-sigma factor